jgi:hypothetical protein
MRSLGLNVELESVESDEDPPALAAE